MISGVSGDAELEAVVEYHSQQGPGKVAATGHGFDGNLQRLDMTVTSHCYRRL